MRSPAATSSSSRRDRPPSERARTSRCRAASTSRPTSSRGSIRTRPATLWTNCHTFGPLPLDENRCLTPVFERRGRGWFGRGLKRELALDADVGGERFQPAGTERRQELLAELEGFVEAAGDLPAGFARLRENLSLVYTLHASVAHAPIAADEDGLDRQPGRAERDLPQRILQRREDVRIEVEQDEIGAATYLDRAEIGRVTHPRRAAARCELPCLARAEPLLVVDPPDL